MMETGGSPDDGEGAVGANAGTDGSGVDFDGIRTELVTVVIVLAVYLLGVAADRNGRTL
jgi:hypothetical protein